MTLFGLRHRDYNRIHPRVYKRELYVHVLFTQFWQPWTPQSELNWQADPHVDVHVLK